MSDERKLIKDPVPDVVFKQDLLGPWTCQVRLPDDTRIRDGLPVIVAVGTTKEDAATNATDDLVALAQWALNEATMLRRIKR